ncbi:MAG: hypothetical protein QG622_3612 [Actinomycetota bacterium]|nr:hypothetical protein [Actinomycetota bacterium]
MKKRYLITVAAAAVCGVTGGIVATGVSAAPLPGAKSAKHCVVDVDTEAERCFEDYRKAMEFASDGSITDAPRDARVAVKDPAFQAKVRAAAQRGSRRAGALDGTAWKAAAADEENKVIAATLFTGPNYTGDSDTIRIPKPCAKDGKYDHGYVLGSVGRSAESLQPWANCWIWLHEGDTFDSARQGPYKEDTPDLGDWKNRAVLMGLS